MINTVKIQGEGYLVNGSMSVPNAVGNRHYRMVQEWIAEGGTPEPEFTQEELDIKSVQEAKALKDKNRLDSMNSLTVETIAGNVYDADETSQNRMSRAINALPDDVTTTSWILADNSVKLVTKAELKEALKLAGEAQTAIWIA